MSIPHLPIPSPPCSYSIQFIAYIFTAWMHWFPPFFMAFDLYLHREHAQRRHKIDLRASFRKAPSSQPIYQQLLKVFWVYTGPFFVMGAWFLAGFTPQKVYPIIFSILVLPALSLNPCLPVSTFCLHLPVSTSLSPPPCLHLPPLPSVSSLLWCGLVVQILFSNSHKDQSIILDVI